MLNTTTEFRQALSAIFWTGWKIATSFKIPGTNINIPEFAMACLMFTVVLRHVPRILGLYAWADHDIVHPEFMGENRRSGSGVSNYSDRNSGHGNM